MRRRRPRAGRAKPQIRRPVLERARGGIGGVAVRHRPRGDVLATWLLVGSQEQAVLRAFTPFSLEQMFVSDTANSFYGAVQGYRVGALLRRFDTLRPRLPQHARSNMPGKLLFAAMLNSIARPPVVQAWLVIVVSNGAGIFLYLLVLEWLGSGEMALFSFVLYLFTPARLYFFPLLNTATPLFAFASLWLVVRAMRTGGLTHSVLLGVTVYALLLFDPLPASLGLLFVGIALQSLRTGSVTPATVARRTAIAIVAFAATYALFVAVFRFDLFRTLDELRMEAATFNVDEGRPYGTWLVQNLLDFGFGVGVCQVALFAAVAIDSVRRPLVSHLLERPVAVATFGLAAIVAVLDLPGGNRGEVVRLWLFLACLWQIPAAYLCARLDNPAAFMLVVAATVLQDAVGTATIGFVLP